VHSPDAEVGVKAGVVEAVGADCQTRAVFDDGSRPRAHKEAGVVRPVDARLQCPRPHTRNQQEHRSVRPLPHSSRYRLWVLNPAHQTREASEAGTASLHV